MTALRTAGLHAQPRRGGWFIATETNRPVADVMLDGRIVWHCVPMAFQRRAIEAFVKEVINVRSR